MNLTYTIINREEITDKLKQKMFELLAEHYTNAFWSDFVSDLEEKRWVILLFCPKINELVGFSTQMLLEPIDNCNILYSGDTIIAHQYWGSMTLPIAFLDLVNNIHKEFPSDKLYWMLISKGLRTYKFLSVFLSEYYPHHILETPEHVKSLMIMAGARKFGDKYIPEKGIIEAGSNDQFLKEEFQPEENSNNPVAAFFYRCNPGYLKGDELLCLAELNEDNLHPFIKRVMKKHVF